MDPHLKSRVDEIRSRLVLNGEGTALIPSDDGEHAVGDIVFLLAQVTSLDEDLEAEREAHDATERALAEAVLERDEARSAHAWRPIETAPKRGRFLARCGDHVLIVRMMRDGIEGFTDEHDVWYPDEWMPLPSTNVDAAAKEPSR